MKASQLINLIQTAIDAHGDLDITVEAGDYPVATVVNTYTAHDDPTPRKVSISVCPEDRSDDSDRRDACARLFIDYNMAMFGDGQEEDIIAGGLGLYRPMYNYTTPELEEWLIDNGVVDSREDLDEYIANYEKENDDDQE